MTIDASSSCDHYFEADREADALRGSVALRAAAAMLVDLLADEGPAVLLARTESALLVCGAAAVLRRADTHVEPAPIGRAGWQPSEGAILVEPGSPSAGLLSTLKRTLPAVRILVLGSVHADVRRTPVATAA